MSRPVEIGVLVVAVALGGGCRRKQPVAPSAPEPLVLLPIEIIDASPGSTRLSEAILSELRLATRRQIEDVGLARLPVSDAAALPDRSSLRVRVLVGCERVVAGPRALERVAAEIKLDQKPGGASEAIHADLLATGEAQENATDRRPPSAVPGEDLQVQGRCGSLAAFTLKDRLGRYLAEWRLRVAPPAELAVALAADAGASRVEAIRVVGERHLNELAPQVLALLNDEDEETRDAALGAVLTLRDRRAVKILTRDRAFGDRHELRKILDAVASLGGQDAEEYLSFVADAHDDAEIKHIAAQALARLRRGDAGAN